MKKYLIIVFLIFLPNLSFATSGACSYHGGVDCKAGPSLYGNATCIDGWVNSSVLFSNTDECKDVQHYCTPEESKNFVSQLNISGLQQQLSDLNSKLTQEKASYDSQFGGVSSQNTPSLFVSGQDAITRTNEATKITDIANQVIVVQKNLQLALATALRECYQLGNAEYEKSQNELFLLKIKQDNQPDIPKISCPENSTIDPDNNTRCICNSGYTSNNSTCEMTEIQSKVTNNKYEKTSNLSSVKVNETIKTKVNDANIQTVSNTAAGVKVTMSQPKYRHWYDYLNPIKWFSKK